MPGSADCEGGGLMAVYEPKIYSVTLSPNPANINTSLFVSVDAQDVETTMYAVSKIAGAAYAGQSLTLTIHKEVSS